MNKKFLLLVIQIFLIIVLPIAVSFTEIDIKLGLSLLKGFTMFCLIFSLTTGVVLYKNLVNIYTIFIMTLFLFNYSRVVLDILNFIDFSKTDWFLVHNFSDNTLVFILNILNQNLIYLNLGVILGFIFVGKVESNKMKENKELEKVTSIIAFGIVPLVIYKLYKEFIYINQIGYLGVYLGYLRNLEFPFIVRVSTTVFVYNYYTFLTTKPNYKKFKLLTFIFLIVSLLEAMKGSRTAFIVRILLVIWYVYNIYRVKIKFLNLVGLLNFIFILSFIIEKIRSNQNVKFESLLNSLGNFLYGQGVSMTLIGFYKEFSKEIPGKLYLFSPIIDFVQQIKNYDVYKLGQSKELIKISTDFAQNISYFLNEYMYLNGMGIGSNYIVELLTFLGDNFFFLGALFLGFQIILIQKICLKSGVSFLVFICFIENLFISSRGTYFFLLINFFKLLFYYIVVLIIGKIIQDLKIKKYMN